MTWYYCCRLIGLKSGRKRTSEARNLRINCPTDHIKYSHKYKAIINPPRPSWMEHFAEEPSLHLAEQGMLRRLGARKI
jgi:hypothetical protein